MELDEAWLPKHSDMVKSLLTVWVSDTFHDRHKSVVSRPRYHSKIALSISL